MRLFLLPISTRRTLIYCERVQQQLAPGQKLPISERILTKAADTWATWEKAPKGWQKSLTTHGNKLLRRIPYEEWGLKSIPPLSKRRLKEIDEGKLQFECLYPGSFLEGGRVDGILRRLAGEREALHRKRLWQSVLLMPVTIPFMIIPVIPNIPFFYLCFRAYSHYRALYGGKLLAYLTSLKSATTKANPITTTCSPILDEMYTAGLLHPTRQASREAPRPTTLETSQVARVVEAQTRGGEEDVMVLQKWNGKLMAERFKLPEMEIEIERAVEQVEAAIEGEKVGGKEELRQEKGEVMRATGNGGKEKEEGR